MLGLQQGNLQYTSDQPQPPPLFALCHFGKYNVFGIYLSHLRLIGTASHSRYIKPLVCLNLTPKGTMCTWMKCDINMC